MNTRAIKRLYSGAALEAWLTRLDSDWEEHFRSEHLEDGRRMYREGLVREIELSEADAIVHVKEDGESRYVVIDWEEGRPRVRSSTGEDTFGHALAAAGLYEIEELVGDEAAALPPDPKPGAEETENGKNGSNGHRTNGNGAAPAAKGSSKTSSNGNGQSALEKLLAARKTAKGKPAANGKAAAHAEPEQDAKPEPEKKPSRRLVLVFTEDPRGLIFSTFWKGFDKKRLPALGSKAEAAGELTTDEREDIIRLASAARRAGFRYLQSEGRYRLESLDSAPSFIRRELPNWRAHFDIETGPGVDRLADGIHEAEVTAHASLGDGGSLKLNWTVRLGDSVLTGDEAKRLVSQGGATVLLPGRGLAHLQKRAAEAAESWQEAAALYADGQFPRYLVFSLFGAEEVKLEMDAPVAAWREQLLQKPDDETLNLPELLRPYQRHGSRWMAHLAESGCHGMLADEMGLGKTLQVLSLLAGRPVDGLPALVVCPASVIPVWQMEAQRFFPQLKVAVLGRDQTFAEVTEGVDLWVSSYTQLRRHKHLLGDVEFGYAVLDEAQFIKNPDAKVTQACCSLRARRRLALTGTPLENRLLDLWTLYRFLMPGMLGSRRRFEAAVAGDPSGLLARLRRQIGPFVLRRTKADVAPELPDKVQAELRCPLTQLQRTEYERLSKEGLQKLGDDISAAKRTQNMNFLSLLTRLRQACCDPALLPWVNQPWEASGKLQILVDRLDEVLSSGRRAVVFSQFVRLLDRASQAIEASFPDVPRLLLTGHTRDRGEPVRQFQEMEGAGVMLVSLRAGGSGITLTNADYVFLLDPWWNPAVEEQAIDRLHRIGRRGNVFVYRLVAAGTIEERIQALQKEKRALFGEALSQATGGDSFEDSFDSLRDLIALLPESND